MWDMVAGKLAAEAIAANPGKSDRAIADERGISDTTVYRARQVLQHEAPEKRTGKDGKQYPAKRKLGELIKAQKETVGLATGGEHGGRKSKDGSRSGPSNARPTLADAGIDKKLSSHAQAMAKIPARLGESKTT